MSREPDASPPGAREPITRRHVAWLAGICAALVALTLPGIFNNRPWCDEAFTASAAWNLITNGVPGTLNMETAGTHWTRIDRITYWTMPLYWMSSAAWFELFGTGVTTLRLFSTLWGVLAVIACFFVVRGLGIRPALALACAALVASDYVFVRGAGDGRFEMMCVSLGWMALAAYLTMRATRFRAACLVSHSLMALSGMTHPNVVPLFVSLVLLQLALDRKHATIKLIASCAIPYLVLGALWLAYASLDMQAFRDQLGGNAGGRGIGLAHPLEAITRELSIRYVGTFWGEGRLSGASRLKAVYLVFFAIGALLPVALRAARIPLSRATRFVGIALAIHVVYFTFLEGYKNPLYLLYLTPLFTLTAVLAIFDLIVVKRAFAVPAFAGLGAMVALGIGAQVMIARRDTMHREFEPMIAVLKQNMKPGNIVFGSAELAFGLGFIPEVIDDTELGRASGRTAQFIVLEERYRDWLGLSNPNRTTPKYVSDLLTNGYRSIYRTEMYEILQRKD